MPLYPLLPNPSPQFCDANGNPYAAGTIDTFVPDTTTPKSTWLDPAGAALNANPIVLDAAGRCVLHGDGLYRLVLKDADGNLIWDLPSSTLVSAAMAPVIMAPTIADALELLGVQDAIDAAVAVETARATAAEAAEAAARAAADAAISAALAAETARAMAAEASLAAAIAAETARATAAESALGGSIGGVLQVRTGTLLTDALTGAWVITFSTPFPTACLTVQAHGMAANPELYYVTLTDVTGFPTLPSTAGAIGVGWELSGGAGAPPVPTLATNLAYTAVGF